MPEALAPAAGCTPHQLHRRLQAERSDSDPDLVRCGHALAGALWSVLQCMAMITTYWIRSSRHYHALHAQEDTSVWDLWFRDWGAASRHGADYRAVFKSCMPMCA